MPKALTGYLCKNTEATAKFSHSMGMVCKLQERCLLRLPHVPVHLSKRTGHGQAIFRDVFQVCETKVLEEKEQIMCCFSFADSSVLGVML